MIYAQVDNDGYVLQIAYGESKAPGEDWVPYPVDGPRFGTDRIRMVGGQPVVTSESLIPPLKYDAARMREYPTVGDQLDVIWKTLSQIADNPEMTEMLERIQSVKAAHPKST